MKVKSGVPVAKSVNDMHNGVLTWAIIELDRTQLPAKATFLLSDLGKASGGLGLGEEGGLQPSTVCKQLNILIVGLADFPGALEGRTGPWVS